MIAQSAQLVRKLNCIAVLALIAAGCSSQSAIRPEAASSPADRAANIALRQVGAPYRYGGATPSGFDCSGLVHYAYAGAGKHIPRTTTALWKVMRPVAEEDLQVGDILFFRIAGKVSHVGMYVGRGQFVHAPSTGKSVSIASLRSDFYQDALIRAGRPY